MGEGHCKSFGILLVSQRNTRSSFRSLAYFSLGSTETTMVHRTGVRSEDLRNRDTTRQSPWGTLRRVKFTDEERQRNDLTQEGIVILERIDVQSC